MKNNTIKWMTLVIVCTMAGCKKDTEESSTVSQTENYSSVTDFYEKNAVPLQTYIINGSTGGSFTTPQGTTVTIPPNAFTTASGQPVTSNVKVEFKDIYKKSDMLLSNKPTTTTMGTMLKSGGECFIKASANDEPVVLAQGKKIAIDMPFEAGGAIADSAMQPFIGMDTIGNGFGGNNPNAVPWFLSTSDSLIYTTNNYIFSLYSFSSPVDSGSWCNSDNPGYFDQYSKISLLIHGTDDVDTFKTDVFLIFKNVNSMVHVYYTAIDEFVYDYAPSGLSCTIVAIGVKDGELYSAFVPLTIANAAMVTDFTLSKTTTSEFKNRLNTLN